MELIRGISGIRGIVGDTLTESTVTRHLQAFSELQGEGDILLARDSRSHGESFIDVGCTALIKCGRNAVNYGI
ncbi:MAG: phosphoglucosamine mutase, partial [Nitrospinaceae bacterium]